MTQSQKYRLGLGRHQYKVLQLLYNITLKQVTKLIQISSSVD